MKDVTGREVKPGDTIIYFSSGGRRGRRSTQATVKEIRTKHYIDPWSKHVVYKEGMLVEKTDSKYYYHVWLGNPLFIVQTPVESSTIDSIPTANELDAWEEYKDSQNYWKLTVNNNDFAAWIKEHRAAK